MLSYREDSTNDGSWLGCCSINDYPLRAICQKGFNPLQGVSPDAIVVEFGEQATVRDPIEGLAEIKYSNVMWFMAGHGMDELIGQRQQLGFAAPSSPETVLTVREDCMSIKVAHYVAHNNVLQYLTCYACQ
ncbi:hypothetical protein DPMN_039480 [Dreissena polymorpha]|uniref:Uncharacterized protein n=1 Tax=Dreissena polymorpha TaxID=45954 RepID=A0A9D4CW20_DREPO|nr:hypothetical protein DPMN_039480 [Dreissena polymorpha]